MAQPQTPTVLQVFLFRGGEFLGTDVFAERRVIVGRDETLADLVLESTEISRRHALIEHDGKRVTIQDFGSTNGVYVNGTRVEQAEVSRLDEIRIGEYALKLKLAGGTARPSVEPMPIEVPAPSDATVAEAVVEVPALMGPPPTAMGPMTEWDDVPDVEAEPTGAVAADATTLDVAALVPVLSAADAASDLLAGVAVGVAPRDENAGEHEGDDDEADEVFTPAFSLVEQLTSEASGSARRGTKAAKKLPYLEVITVRGDTVADVTLLRPGSSFWIGPRVGFLRRRRARDLSPRLRLLRYRRNGVCIAELRDQTNGDVMRAGQVHAARDLAAERNPRRRTRILPLDRDDVLDVTVGPYRYHARFVYPPPRMQQARPLKDRMRPSPLAQRALGSSFASHLVVLLLLGITLPTQVQKTAQASDDFVEVIIDPEVTLDEETREPPAEAETEAPPVSALPAPTPKKRVRQGGTSKAPSGVLGLLSKRGSAAASGPAAAVAAVSNLSAARVPGGTSGFRVSGLMGKLPTSDLSVGGGGGGVVTKGGTALLRGGGGGAGQLSGKGTRQVGGIVQKVPQAMRAVGQGSLDRDAIQKVINENIGQIQRCYERELIQNPGLSGKIQVEWTIGTSGTVRGARQSYSSLASTTVASCILTAVKSWRFPRPKGGEVVVNYPFIFKSIGF